MAFQMHFSIDLSHQFNGETEIYHEKMVAFIAYQSYKWSVENEKPNGAESKQLI